MHSYNFDYSQTMMMKLDIANPDNRGGSILHHTFAQALDKIKIMDALTLGVPKILYLVGWQYLGHDDRYPAFFEVNNHAKRPQDASGRESLLWLISEARRYHTTVSLHINLSDAYADSPLWQAYLDNDLILLNRRGKPKATGVWNGRTAYQVRFAKEFASGYFQKRMETLFALLPIAQMQTIHVDAFFVRKGKDTPIAAEKEARRNMIAWLRARGVDVTSEFIYREWNNGYRALWGKSDIIGLIPAIWNLKMTQREFLRYSPQLLAGGRLCKGIQRDMGLDSLFYGNIMGENLFGKKDWQALFLEEFATVNLPYFYLNRLQRKCVRGIGKGRTAYFTQGVTTTIRGEKIEQNGALLKQGKTVCLPIPWQKNSYYAYSSVACEKSWPVQCNALNIQTISETGLGTPQKLSVKKQRVHIRHQARTAYLLTEA